MTIKDMIKVGMIGVVLTGTTAVAEAAESTQTQTQQQIQLNTQERVGPDAPKANQQQKQYKNTYEYRYEKQNQDRIGDGAQDGNRSDRSTTRPMNRSFDGGMGSNGSMNRAGGGGGSKR